MAYCTECGQSNRPSARFCRACGARIELLEEEMSPSLARPGTIIGGRYRVRAVSESPGGSLVCEAEDVLSCWSCAAIQPQPGLRYCETCGVELSRWQPVTLVEVTPSGQPLVPSDQLVQHQGKIFRVEAAQPDGAPALPGSAPDPAGLLRFQVGQQTDTGAIRDGNEDSLIVYQLTAVSEDRPAPQIQFFAVADGIGGHAAGEVASRAAVRALLEELQCRVVAPLLTGGPLAADELPAGGEPMPGDGLGEPLREMVRRANARIFEARQEKGLNMGCTLTAALFSGADGVVANVGDSRTYLFRAGQLAQVTADHSVVANLVAGGVIKPEEAFLHTQRNVILRSLGDKAEIEIDLFSVRARPDDRFLLCSDGLWEMVRDSVIEAVLREIKDPQQACARLVQAANSAGGEDNISVILVDVLAQ